MVCCKILAIFHLHQQQFWHCIEAFRHGAAISSGGLCLGWRSSPSQPYQWNTYEEVIKRAKNFGSGLISMGMRPGVHSMVGIYSRNCPEWIVAEQGVYSYSMVLVPLYDSLGPDARSFVLSQCEMRSVHNLQVVPKYALMSPSLQQNGSLFETNSTYLW